jgi:hypothetical protein
MEPTVHHRARPVNRSALPLLALLIACDGAVDDKDEPVVPEETDRAVDTDLVDDSEPPNDDSEPTVDDTEPPDLTDSEPPDSEPPDSEPHTAPDTGTTLDLTLDPELASTLVDLSPRLWEARDDAGMFNFAPPLRTSLTPGPSGGGSLAGSTLICEGLFGQPGELFVIGADDTNVDYTFVLGTYDPPTAFVPIWHLQVTGNDAVLTLVMKLSDLPGNAWPQDGAGDTACADLNQDGHPDLVLSGTGTLHLPGGGTDFGGRFVYWGTAEGFVNGLESLPYQQEVLGDGSRNTLLIDHSGDWYPSVFKTSRETQALAETPNFRGEGAVAAWRQVAPGDYLPSRGFAESGEPMANPYFLATWTVPQADGSFERYLYAPGDYNFNPPAQGGIGHDISSGYFRNRPTVPGDAVYLSATHTFEEVDHLALLPNPTVYSTWVPAGSTEELARNPMTWLPMGHALTYNPARDRLLGWTTSTREEDPVWTWGGWRAPTSLEAVQLVSGRHRGSPRQLWTFADPGDGGRYWGVASFGDGRYLVQGNGLDGGERASGAADTMTDHLVFDVTGQGHYQRATDLTPLANHLRSGHAISTAVLPDGRGILAIGTLVDTTLYNGPQVLYVENERGVLPGEHYLGVWVDVPNDVANGAWVSVYRGDGSVFKRAMIGADDGQPTLKTANDMVRFSIEAGIEVGSGPDELHQVCVEYPDRVEQCEPLTALDTRLRIEPPEILRPPHKEPVALTAAPQSLTFEVQCPAWLDCQQVQVSGTRFGTATVTPDGAGGWEVTLPVPSLDDAAALVAAHSTPEHEVFQARWEGSRGTVHLGILPVTITARDASGVVFEDTVSWHLEGEAPP